MYPSVEEGKELIAELCKLFYTQARRTRERPAHHAPPGRDASKRAWASCTLRACARARTHGAGVRAIDPWRAAGLGVRHWRRHLRASRWRRHRDGAVGRPGAPSRPCPLVDGRLAPKLPAPQLPDPLLDTPSHRFAAFARGRRLAGVPTGPRNRRRRRLRRRPRESRRSRRGSRLLRRLLRVDTSGPGARAEGAHGASRHVCPRQHRRRASHTTGAAAAVQGAQAERVLAALHAGAQQRADRSAAQQRGLIHCVRSAAARMRSAKPRIACPVQRGTRLRWRPRALGAAAGPARRLTARYGRAAAGV